ncbi:MAG TPA: lipid-A-disaccharide synthase [Nitrospirae bacterium]|nr:lipid-A-disaccharide synthase [Nitrospirota bacterium]
MSEGQKRVLIVSGEASGELYGALLAERLFDRYSDILIYGVGGERMRKAGVKLIGEITGAFGITETFSSLSRLQKNYDSIIRCLDTEHPEVVVLIDFPDFNLKVARAAKERGLKVLYYVGPQVWAWRKKRIRTIVSLTDAIAVILPFEEEIYRKNGARCEFVGHPIMEEILAVKGSRGFIRQSLGLRPDGEVLALLPGSRDSELKRLLPLYLEVVGELSRRYGSLQYILPLAVGIDRKAHRALLGRLQDRGVRLVDGRSTEALMAADYALIASGTATLQAALIGVPMVVVYKLFPLTYIIGRLVVNVKYISLVNILYGGEIVKELIQWKANKSNVLAELERLIREETVRRNMKKAFNEIRDIYYDKRPSERVAEMTGEIAGWQ